MLYSFTILFDRYNRTHPVLQDIRSLYVSNICVLAKNSKYGNIYKSKYVSSIVGKISWSAGSNSSPIIYPITDLKINVCNFPEYPTLNLSGNRTFVSIENIKKQDEQKVI